MNCRKTILFSEGQEWIKKDDVFDVSMGAEVAELVGLLILYKLREAAPRVDFGLYRDDGLGDAEPMPGPTRERTKKKIIKTMKDLGLNITIEFGLKIVDFLEVTLNLNNSTYKPYRKPNDEPCYININSNHPPNCIKQLPKMINSRLNSISSNAEVFREAVPIYRAALEKSGHIPKLRYEQERPRRRQRKRNITWYNPPFNKACKTNIGKEFLRLLDKHFPQNRKRKDKLEQIMNRHCIKLSYSGTQSMGKIISSHNAKVMNDRKRREEPVNTCNCQQGVETCPMSGNCQASAIVYKATVKANDGEEKTYTGCTDRTFKERHYGHRADERDRELRKNTKLATYIWEKKDSGVGIEEVKWEILKQCVKYAPGGDKCDVCLSEKLCIMKNKDIRSLNKRGELMNTCRHRARWRLVKVKNK